MRKNVRRRRKQAASDPPPPPDISGVEVVGEAVVGPYALEIITAEQGENLSNWLLVNGYQIPPSAIPAMNHYIGLKMAFLGIKLQSDVPAGPIEALSFTYPGHIPSIPLILTAVAATENMEIVAYVAGPGRHVPGNYADIDFDYVSVRWLGESETDYPLKLDAALDMTDGRAFNTEYADILGRTGVLEETPLAEVLERDDYITRFHTFMSAPAMTTDPYWVRDAEAEDVDNHHVLEDDLGEPAMTDRGPGGPGGVAALLVLPALWIRRRRTRPVPVPVPARASAAVAWTRHGSIVERIATTSTSPRGSLRVSPIVAPSSARATGLVHASRPASGSPSSSPTMR